MNKVVIIDALRTPFFRSWTEFKNLNSLDLSKRIVNELIKKTSIQKNQISEIIFGSVFPPTYSPNIAREIILSSDLPKTIPAFTVTKACASGIQAITCASDSIYRDSEKLIISGGVDSISQMNFPINEKLKNFLNELSENNIIDYQEKASKFIPKIPKLFEISTNLMMGEYADIMAQENKISREEQDLFALNSHKKAFKAFKEGHFEHDILKFNNTILDNNIRLDVSIDSISKLKPAFNSNGTVTAGNSSPLTDGAAAIILTSEKKSKELNYSPKAIIKDYVYSAIDTKGQMLMGNAYSIPMLLKRNKLNINDIDFFEMHEAFSSQVLSTLQALNSKKFSNDKLSEHKEIGDINPEKLNIYGGSIAIGHPFGATGIRLIQTMSNILNKYNKKLGIVSVCAAGGMSASVLIEKFD